MDVNTSGVHRTHFLLLGLCMTTGERELGLQIAEHGLTLERPIVPLAHWLRDTAAIMGKTALALSTAEILFREELNLPNYLRAGELASEQWPQRGPDLRLRRHKKLYSPQGLCGCIFVRGAYR